MDISSQSVQRGRHVYMYQLLLSDNVYIVYIRIYHAVLRGCVETVAYTCLCRFREVQTRSLSERRKSRLRISLNRFLFAHYSAAFQLSISFRRRSWFLLRTPLSLKFGSIIPCRVPREEESDESSNPSGSSAPTHFRPSIAARAIS